MADIETCPPKTGADKTLAKKIQIERLRAEICTLSRLQEKLFFIGADPQFIAQNMKNSARKRLIKLHNTKENAT